MARINTLRSFHEGNLPIRVLSPDLMDVFQRVHHEFIEELQYEVVYGGMPKEITYDNRKNPIAELAYIDDNGIYINEGYLAFVWCLANFIITIQREIARPPVLNNPRVLRAIGAFDYSLTLFNAWTPWDLALPNPEEYDIDIDPYIEEANGLYLYAACLILCHEFAHQQLGHVDDEDETNSINDEFAADRTAAQTFLTAIAEYGRQNPRAETTRLGAIIGMGSIFFPYGDFFGGPTHPDVDERLARVVDLFTEGDDENDLWRWATGILIAWALIYNKDVDVPGYFEEPTPKAQFNRFVSHLKAQMLA